MHPTAPSPAPPPAPMPGGNNNPYEFIMDGNKKPKRTLGGGSMKQRLIIIVAGAGLLLVVFLVFISVISSGGSSSSDTLIKLAQQENEIARVAGLAKDKAAAGNTKNLATTTQLSMQTTQANTLAVLKKKGHNVKPKQLVLSQDSTTDQQLTAASNAGNFDATFTQVLQTELASYRAAVQNAYKNSTSNTEKQLLQSSFNNITYLLGAQKTT